MRAIIIILVLTAIVSVVGIGFGIATYVELQRRGDADAGKILAANADGTVAPVSDYATGGSLIRRFKDAVRTSATVESTGAGALNVTVEVRRHDRLRSWTITSTPGEITSEDVIRINLSGTGVLDPLRDAPLLPAHDPTEGLPVDCDYYSYTHERQFSCIALVYVHNSTLTITPIELGYTEDQTPYLHPKGMPMFDEDLHVGTNITIASTFSWFIP